jgi:uncharacterized membrane protein
VLSLVLLAALVGPRPVAQADQSWGYTPVVTSWVGPGDFEVSETGNPINGAGLVAGHVTVDGSPKAALFNTRSGNVYELDGLPAGCDTYALDVNEQTHVVGYQKCSVAGSAVGFLWTSPREPVRYLDASPGAFTLPSAMNDHDLVVGAYGAPIAGGPPTDHGTEGFLWSPSTPKISLMGDLGGGETFPLAVNNGGYVTGSSLNRRSQYLPFLWLPDQKKLIGLRVPDGWHNADGDAINDRGFIVGTETRADTTLVFVWSPITTSMSLLPAPADSFVIPRAINAGGVVVGQVGTYDGVGDEGQSVVWETCGGPVHVLPRAAGSIGAFGVFGINVYGRIVGDEVFNDLIQGVTVDGTWWDRPTAQQGAVHLACRS